MPDLLNRLFLAGNYMYDLLNRPLSIPLVSVPAGLIVGGGITWLVAWRYYKKAGDELRAEASRLHSTTERILQWLEAAAKGEDLSVTRNPDGVSTGWGARPVSLKRSRPQQPWMRKCFAVKGRVAANLSQHHPDQVEPDLARLRTEDIAETAAEAYEVVEDMNESL